MIKHDLVVFIRKAIYKINSGIPCIRCGRPIQEEMLDGWGGGLLRIPCAPCFIEGKHRMRELEKEINKEMSMEDRYLFVQLFIRELVPFRK